MDSLWCQATGPIESPLRGAMRHGSKLVHVLNGVQEYRWRYLGLFGDLPDTTGWPASARPAIRR